MSRRLIAAALSASLAMGALAPLPALAGDRQDLNRLLGGIATVVILGATYDHLRDRKNRRHAEPAPAPRRERHAKIVPARCFERVETRHGGQLMFGQRCLRRNMHNVNRLPQACAIRIRTHEGPRRGYAARCLRDYGWRRG